MANGGSIGSSIGMDVENIGSGIIALEELGSLAQRVGDQAVEALGNISVDVLVTAITEVTVALENLTSTLQDSTNCGTIYEEIALGISSLSLACDLFTGEKVRRFIVDEALDLKTVTVELANCSAAWVKNTAVAWLHNAAMTAWRGICAAATTVTTALGAAMNFLTSPIGLVVIGITALIAVIVLLIANWDTARSWLIAGWTEIQETLGVAAEWFDTAIIQPLQQKFAAFWEGVVGVASAAWEGIKSIFESFGDFFCKIFSVGWERVMALFQSSGNIFNGIVGGVGEFFFRVVNGLIDGINAMIADPFESINVALRFVRDISIMGVQPFRGLGLIDVWKIPHLAQGAVLPANRPFLAVVGDQKHGANVEAPLETIQEAVALVMGDVVASNMAGHEATVGVLREILDAVLGIEIGDEVIGRAAARYGSRMAVVRGVR